MPKLPIVSGKEIVKALSKIGFEHIRTKGDSFLALGAITIPVPLHKELAKGTLKSIMGKLI